MYSLTPPPSDHVPATWIQRSAHPADDIAVTSPRTDDGIQFLLDSQLQWSVFLNKKSHSTKGHFSIAVSATREHAFIFINAI